MVILILALLSLVTLQSIAPQLLDKQALYFVVGAGIFFVTAQVSFERWQALSPYLYAVMLVLLFITQLIGRVTRGATSWIPIGSFHIQPSQLGIVVTGLLIVTMISKRPVRSIPDLLRIGLLIDLPAFLIFIQPELGTTIIYAISLAVLLFVARTRISLLVLSFICIAVLSVIGWNFILRPYQKDRLSSFINAQQDQLGAGYNALQSMIAVGSGEIYGRGIGQGVQSHLRFLPERQTDFVFASFAEETGLLGALPVVFLYGSLTFFLIYVGFQFQKPAERYFAFLTATMIAVQAGINIGMNMGLFPITGITLPLFSYGGSSILALCFHFGCVQSMIRRLQRQETLFIT